ncbi:MAG: hypothetical protein R2939_00255 [Kofleriaceae bacterium]
MNFPVDVMAAPACDARGNLLVTSTTAVRLLPAAISRSAPAPASSTGPAPCRRSTARRHARSSRRG